MSVERGTPRLHDENVVLVVSAVVAVAPALLLWLAFDRRMRVVFLVALAVATVPVFVYRGYWPARYDRTRAAGWTVAAATVVAVEMAVITALLAGRYGPRTAVTVAFVVVVLVDYVLPSRLLR